MVINPSSISFEQVRADIIAYINSTPNSNVWKDRYAGGAGITIVELLAGLSAYLQYTIAASRRETFLDYATAQTSGIAISQNLGYSTYRGKNSVLTLTILPSVTTLIPKLTEVGSFGDYFLYTSEDVILTNGVEQDINLIIGELGTETIIAPSSDLQVFRFLSSDVSEDLKITLNQSGGTPVDVNWYSVPNPISYLVESQYYWVLSNALGGIDVLYLNNPDRGYTQFKYITGSTLLLSYIKLNDITFSIDNIPLELYYGTSIIASVVLGSGGIPEYVNTLYIAPETIDSIKVNAPIAHEAGSVVRGRWDYKKQLKDIITSVTGLECVDTNGQDVSPAVVELTYVLADGSTLESGQMDDILDALDYYRPYGVSPPTLSDPIELPWDVTITLYLLSTSIGYISSVVEADIRDILKAYEYKLEVDIGTTVKLDIEHLIDELSYVKASRVQYDTGLPFSLDWDEYLKLGTVTIIVA